MLNLPVSDVSVVSAAWPLRAVRAIVFMVSCGTACVAHGATFSDAAAGGGGLGYAREPAPLFAAIEALRTQSLSTPLPPESLPTLPNADAILGLPGVAIFDHDLDGDLDFYVTNGPGAANGLFSNQLMEAGEVSFVDVASHAGVALVARNSTGVCFGDIDNDGDGDLLVVGHNDPNVLLENLGGGVFVEVPGSGLGTTIAPSTSCSFGDINGDGLLDVAVVNVFPDDNLLPIFAVPFALNQPNELYLNQGDGTFADVSVSSGFRDLGGLPPGVATISWAVAMADVDEDGDIDIVQADDQAAFPSAKNGGLDRGYMHVFMNDGTGHFTDAPIIETPESAGSWMGIAFGDVNCDGHLDLLGSNFGDYDIASMGVPYRLGDQSTRLMLGRGDGSYADTGLALGASAFGWGNAIFDYDNDGDSDLLYHGGLDMLFVGLFDNPGVLLENHDCGASFTLKTDAFSIDHTARSVHGMAIGDLDGNGFMDVVSVSNQTASALLPLLPSPAVYGSPLDATAKFSPTFLPSPQGMVWSGVEQGPGDLAVELNDGNQNRWVTITTLGSIGLTHDGVVNRDGIGAVVSFTPRRGSTVKYPVQGGSSFLSQHSLELGFGLGAARRGMAEVFWPGGTRNRLYGVRSGEKLLFPEIPCSFEAAWPSFFDYAHCVSESLDELGDAGVLSGQRQVRFFVSALLAYLDVRH